MSTPRNRGLWTGLVTALLVLCVAPPAMAAEITYAIAGIETGFTATTSSFAGTALANDGDFAVWDALVQRGPFNAKRDAEITGGAIRINGQARDLQGVIDDAGTITNLRRTCQRETFLIEGTITLVDGQGLPTGGKGQFAATLTHYGQRVNGQCFIFFATVEGSVTFTLP
jgi:hypothetical protein